MCSSTRIFLLIMLSGCSLEGPKLGSCPTLLYPTELITGITPQETMVLLFDRPVSLMDSAVHLVKARDAGYCTPACTGSCAGGRCFIPEVDEAFLSDASSGQLTNSRQAATTPVEAWTSVDRLFVRPALGSFTPETVYQLVLTPRILDAKGMPLRDPDGTPRAFALTLLVGPETRFGPDLILRYPDLGARRIPLNLSWLILESSEPLGHLPSLSLALYAPKEGELIPLELERRSICGETAADCLILHPGSSLQPERSYSLKVLTDTTLPSGGLLPSWVEQPWFTTGEITWAFPITLSEPETGEVTGCFHVSWEASGEALYDLVLENGAVDRRFFGLRGPFETAVTHSKAFRLRAQGVDGSVVTTRWFEPSSQTISPGVVITEVYANPVGAEPTQEYIEIQNAGPACVDLEGWRITDDLEEEGDLLPSYTLAPGARALIVGSTFRQTLEDPFPEDPQQLISLANGLVKGGMGNSGEPLYLFDSGGTLSSRYGGWGDFTGRDGQSMVRTMSMACDIPESWSFSTPSPGQ